MRELSLFSGAGGGLLGTKLLGWECIGYVEFNDYCQRVLKQRILDGIFEKAPIFSDIRAFLSEGFAESYKGMVDVITAGFPCQPFSVAGKGLAENDERNMWPQTKDCISIIRPKYCLLENVPGLLTHGYIRRIFGDLAEMGYDCKWGIIGANDTGAPHRRKRLWIVGNSKCTNAGRNNPRKSSGIGMERGENVLEKKERSQSKYQFNASSKMAYPQKKHGTWFMQKQGGKSRTRKKRMSIGGCSRISWWDHDPAEIPNSMQKRSPQWETEEVKNESVKYNNGSGGAVKPRLGRVADGVAYRVDRLKANGNGQVPAVVKAAWEILSQ